MTAPVRQGGHLVEADGRETTWTVAEGQRGRRWRWTSGRSGGIAVAHTLETDPSGRFLRVESAGPWGLLTLHREADGSLHGHRVGSGGVDHLAMPRPAPSLVLVGVGPVGAAAFLAAVGGLAEAVSLEVILVGDDGSVVPDLVHLRPIGRRSVELGVRGQVRAVTVDPDGLPVRPDGGPWWALEHD